MHPNVYLLLQLFEIHPRGLNGFNEAGQAPHAYKNIDVVIDDLVEAGLATVIATFRPAHKRKYWYFTLACYAEKLEFIFQLRSHQRTMSHYHTVLQFVL